MKSELSRKPVPEATAGYGEFATPIWYQFLVCIQRMFQQYYRSPGYLYSKTAMCVFPVRNLSLPRHDCVSGIANSSLF